MQIVNSKSVSTRPLAGALIGLMILGALASLAGLAIPLVRASGNIKVNQQNTFEGITFNTTGTLAYNSSYVKGGSLKLKITDGTIIVTTTYTINTQEAYNNEVHFLLFAHVNDSSNIEVAAYVFVNVSSGTVVGYAGARNADINKDGVVDYIDYEFGQYYFGTCPGGSQYDPRADLAATGCIGIVDESLWGSVYLAPEYR